MGLDQYLTHNRLICGFPFRKDSLADEAEKQLYDRLIYELGMSEYAARDESPMIETKVTVAYWRKAHAIHGWFVQVVQGGTDDCGNYYVTPEQLQQLLDLCRRALETGKRPTALEPRESYFFGAREDDWYLQDLRSTIDQLSRVLSMPDHGSGGFYYHASW